MTSLFSVRRVYATTTTYPSLRYPLYITNIPFPPKFRPSVFGPRVRRALDFVLSSFINHIQVLPRRLSEL